MSANLRSSYRDGDIGRLRGIFREAEPYVIPVKRNVRLLEMIDMDKNDAFTLWRIMKKLCEDLTGSDYNLAVKIMCGPFMHPNALIKAVYLREDERINQVIPYPPQYTFAHLAANLDLLEGKTKDQRLTMYMSAWALRARTWQAKARATMHTIATTERESLANPDENSNQADERASLLDLDIY